MELCRPKTKGYPGRSINLIKGGVALLEQFSDKVKKVADLLQESNYTVIFTGAGVSTEHYSHNLGSPGRSLPVMVAPEDFTIGRFKDDPQSFYEEGEPFFSMIYQLEPNEVHTALAELEKRGLLKVVITENIDGLHKKAGSKRVLEIRGTLRSASCEECKRQVAIDDLLADAEKGSFLPVCPDCGEPLRPDVVFSDEPLPPDYYEAKDEAGRAELMVVIGSALEVSPDNQLPAECKNLVIINQNPTLYDQQAQVVINESPVKVMKLLLEELNNRK